MAKVYLVDSENIGSGWSQLLASMTEADRMFVFYTDKSPYISYENLLQVIAYCNIPVFLKCYEGKNALDFQLVSELGFKLCESPGDEFIIVSDDYGYDAAVKYWAERNYNVCRIGKKLCKPAAPKQNNRSEQTEVVAVQTKRFEKRFDKRNGYRQETASEKQAEELIAAAEYETVEAVEADAQQMDAAETAAEKDSAEPVVSEELIAEEQAEESAQEKETVTETVEEAAVNEEAVTENAAENTAEELPDQQTDETEQSPLNVQTEEVQPVEEKASEEVQESIAEQPTAEEGVTADAVEAATEEAADGQPGRKEGQSQKRSRERRKRNKKEAVKENEKAAEAIVEDIGYQLDLMLVDIARRSGSEQPEVDARCVKELFYTIKMSDLTNLNTALKILIGNEMGNDIYRELKEHSEYREQLDALYCPVLKNRFVHYVQIVLDRNGVKDVTAENMGSFLLEIPRKNLNSIRSAMLKEYGHENGAMYYTILKAHIKVLNRI